MKKKYNYIFNLFLFFYLILGFYFSVNTGIATDEPRIRKKTEIN